MSREENTKCIFPPRGESEPPDCPHDAADKLGEDAGRNVYYRCRECDAVIVTFSRESNWEQQRENRIRQRRDMNPLLRSLRDDQPAASDSSPIRRQPDRSLSDWVQTVWRRLGLK